MPRTGSSVAGLPETWPCPGSRSTAPNPANRVQRRTGKAVTESNLSLSALAQRADAPLCVNAGWTPIMSAAIQIRAFCGARDPAWSGTGRQQVRELARRGHVGGRAYGRDPRASAGDSRGLPATALVSGLFLARVSSATDVSGAVPDHPGYMRTARPALGRVCGSPRPAVRIGAGNDPCPGYLRRRDRSHGQVGAVPSGRPDPELPPDRRHLRPGDQDGRRAIPARQLPHRRRGSRAPDKPPGRLMPVAPVRGRSAPAPLPVLPRPPDHQEELR
jgi:hypothetical protein